MTLIPIRTYPDPVLKQKASSVEEFSPRIQTLLDNMAETMYRGHGIGLAANQVGLLHRMIVVDVSGEGDARIDFVNPRIVWKEGSICSEEGCLSIPDYRDTVKRAKRIAVEAQDAHGRPFAVCAEGLLAICIQHEIDHLDGVLFVDRLSRLKRELFKRWYGRKNAETGT